MGILVNKVCSKQILHNILYIVQCTRIIYALKQSYWGAAARDGSSSGWAPCRWEGPTRAPRPAAAAARTARARRRARSAAWAARRRARQSTQSTRPPPPFRPRPRRWRTRPRRRHWHEEHRHRHEERDARTTRRWDWWAGPGSACSSAALPLCRTSHHMHWTEIDRNPTQTQAKL